MLEEIIAQINSYKDLPKKIAPQVADELRNIIAGNVKAQRNPDGSAWPKGQYGQSSVLTGAMSNISVNAIGAVITARVEGPEARHHLGAVKGKVVRQLIPSSKVPHSVVEAIRKALASWAGSK